MKSYASLAAAIILCLSSCTAQESYQNAESCAQVTVGMTQEQVRHLMGEPTGNDANGESHTWSYLFGSATDTQPIKIMFDADGKVVGKECAPEASGRTRPTGN